MADNRSPVITEPRPTLRVWDAVSVIVGIVVGTAIFRSPPLVYQNVSTPLAGLGVWLLGGFLSLMGAFCYAELATAFPRMGGEYEYLRRAYGTATGFLFAWGQLIVILTGSIGSVAYAFADYAGSLFGRHPGVVVSFAAAIIVFLTVTNCFGMVVGKRLQNLLSMTKVLALLLVATVGLLWGSYEGVFAAPRPIEGAGLGLALVFVLYAYGGWNECAFLAAEVEDQKRDLSRALIYGIAGITALYLLVNVAYLAVLSFEELRGTATPAEAVLSHVFGTRAGQLVSIMIMLSAAGAINGMIFTGARVYVVLGQDFPSLGWLARWDTKRAAPIQALLVQGIISLAFVLLVGTRTGQRLLDSFLAAFQVGPIPWEQYQGGFEALVAGTAPVFWFFFSLSGLSVVVLRQKYPNIERPFRVPFYPVPVLFFVASSVYMLWSSLAYARWLALIGVIPVLCGIPFFVIDRVLRNRAKTNSGLQ